MASASSTPKARWEVKALGDLSEVVTKGTTPTSVGYKFTEQGIAFVKVESITPEGNFLGGKLARINKDCHNSLKRSQLKAGDILFSIAGASLGRTAIVSNEILPANTNQALAIIRLKPSDNVSLRFIEKALSTGFVLDQVEKLKGGVAQQNLSLSQVRSFRIPLPPFPEQERIVRILDEAFDGIAAATAQAEKNLHNAHELFQSVLQSTFSQKGDDWEEVEVQEVTKLSRGHNPPKSTFVYTPQAGYVRFYQIRDGNSDAHKVYVPETPQLHRVLETDILMVAYRHVGRAFRGANGAFNVALCKITNANPDRLDDDFLFYLVPTDLIRGELLKLSERSLIPSMSVKELARLKIPLPPLPTQQAIVEKLDALSEETKALEAVYERKQSALAELKQSLLQKAFAGEL